MSAARRRFLVIVEMVLRVRRSPLLSLKRGPGGLRQRATKNFRMAETGQVEVPVAPISTVADFPNLSVLERFRWIDM